MAEENSVDSVDRLSGGDCRTSALKGAAGLAHEEHSHGAKEPENIKSAPKPPSCNGTTHPELTNGDADSPDEQGSSRESGDGRTSGPAASEMVPRYPPNVPNGSVYQQHLSPKNNYGHQKPSPSRKRFTPSPNSRGTSPNQGSSNVVPAPSGANQQHVVHLHVNPGETISFQIGDQMQLIQGPATVRMVSSNSTPPIPMPVQVPPGHMVQQIVDENGTLRHIILSPQPPIAVPMGNPYNPGPTGNTGHSAAPNPFFSYPHPPYPHPQFHPHSHMQPGLTPHTHQGHTPLHTHQTNNHQGTAAASLTQHQQKDERTQRQFFRLKKKLEARQKGEVLILPQNSPSSSPKKDIGLRRYRNGNSSAQSLDGSEENQSQDDEDDTHILLELLSCVKAPIVSDIGSRSASVQWRPPDLCTEDGENKYTDYYIQESAFLYELLLSDRGKDAKAKVIFSGAQLQWNLTELKPSTEYHVCIRAILEDIVGNPSEAFSFKTECCEPDTPQTVKLSSKTRTSLSVKWNTTADNGSKISSYILEYDEGKGGDEFVEICNGMQKQFKVNKLNASTCYRFRLAAVNERGTSPYSEISCFSTSGSAPSQPLPPALHLAHINRLQLEWQKRPVDDDFTLQMEDESSRHGFLPVYNGRECGYTCGGLRRNWEYKFRLCANNEEGSSPWSKVVVFKTLPDRPGNPGKPAVKGKIHATSFRVEWDDPKDNGGAAITKYILELDSGNGFEMIYSGPEREFTCDSHLSPGTTYRLRVSCVGVGGQSHYSEVSSISTTPVCPGKCAPPRLHGKPKALSLHLKWGFPESDGGSPVADFEIDMTSPDNTTRMAYRGRDTDCVVAGLLPGRPYLFQVRATNKVGPGPWSQPLEVVSGAGPPDTPQNVAVLCRSPHGAVVSWEEPVNNGSAVTEYRLEWCQSEDGEYTQLYSGSSPNYEAKSMTPASSYFFRVQAINSAGAGPFSEVVACTTPSSSPGAISSSSLKLSATATSLGLSWKPPNFHGSEILHYNVEIGEALHGTQEPEILVHDLIPEATYRVRVQAVNAIGPGPFSSVVKVTTRSLPPSPPSLECAAISHNGFRLKWGEGRNPDFIQYTLEMENRNGSFVPIYQGTSHSHKVSKLQETTPYTFRIYASNEAGSGPSSPLFVFQTAKAPPPALKAPKVSVLSETSCEVEWQAVKQFSEDHLSYQLQLMSYKELEYQMVYKGAGTSFRLEGLEPRTNYSVRVAAIRHCGDGSGDLLGAFSPMAVFSTPSLETAARTSSPKAQSASGGTCERQPLSDQQWAIIIVLGFTLFAILAAMLIEQLFSYGKPAS